MSAGIESGVAHGEERKASGLDWLASISLQLASACYLGWVIEAGMPQWLALSVGFVVVPTMVLLFLYRIVLGGTSLRRGEDPEEQGAPESARPELERVLDLPGALARRHLIAGLLPIALVPTTLALVGEAQSISFGSMRSLVLASVLTTSFSSGFVLYAARRRFAPIRTALGLHPQPGQSGQHFRWASDGEKEAVQLAFASAVPFLAALLLVSDATAHQLRRQWAAEGARWGTAAPGSVASDLPVFSVSADSFVSLALIFGLTILMLFVVRSRAIDLTHRLEGIASQARRLAKRDLASLEWDPSRDGIGAVSRSLLDAQVEMKTVVDRARVAAGNVDGAIVCLNEVLTGMTRSGTETSRRVEAAHRLVGAMHDQLGSARGSAEELAHSIDQSSSSVCELSAAGTQLSETSSALSEKVTEVSGSLEQMVASVKQVSSTTDQLAEASEQTSSSMEEMASAMRAVDTSAATTANLSRDVVDKAELGQAKVVQTIEGMEAIREATDVAESVIRGLGARTNEIGGILDVIEDVADETNLLALNAAIIAAQAGEQGKAFSVVADEIKELADRVLASTKEIGGLIRAVQEESENAIGAIEAGSASVMSGVDLSAEAGRTLEEITEASRESGTRIAEIVNSVREQTRAASHVVTLMERVRESADQIGAASADQDRGNEVVYRSALVMREMVDQVRETTEAQTAGLGQIREHAAGVNGAVERITGSLGEQADAFAKFSEFLDQIASESHTKQETVERIRESILGLSSSAGELREDVSRFRC